jgi:hypothetical protein
MRCRFSASHCFRFAAFVFSIFRALALMLLSAFPYRRFTAEAVNRFSALPPGRFNDLLDISAKAFMQEGASAGRRFAASPEKRQAAKAHREGMFRDYFGH